MKAKEYILQDSSRNHDVNMRVLLIMFRTAQLLRLNKILKYTLYVPLFFIYKFTAYRLYGIELPIPTKVGSGLRLYHGMGIVINSEVVIGNNVTIRQCTTIGNKGAGGASPVIGDNVNIGCNSVILGDIYIGDNSKIGAGSIVVKDVPSNSVVMAEAAKIIGGN